MTQLKRLSDAMLLLAIAFLVVAIVGPSWAYWVAGFCLLDSVVLNAVRRRRIKVTRAARQPGGKDVSSSAS